MGTIILMITHGYPVKQHDDPLVKAVDAAVNGFSECLEPGAYLVDMIPLRESLLFFLHATMDVNNAPFLPRVVRYVPEWFPRAGWKTKGKRYTESLEFMTEIPHQFVKDQMVSLRSW